MRVVKTLLTCLLHSGKSQEFTISSIEHGSFNPNPVTLRNTFQTLPDQYADDYHSVCQMTVIPQKMSHQLPEPL